MLSTVSLSIFLIFVTVTRVEAIFTLNVLDQTFPLNLAEFGKSAADLQHALSLQLVFDSHTKDSRYGCSHLKSKDISGKAVLLRRGNCSFSEKARHIQQAGGKLLIIGSGHEEGLIDMVYDGDNPPDIHIPVFMMIQNDFAQIQHNLPAQIIVQPPPSLPLFDISSMCLLFCAGSAVIAGSLWASKSEEILIRAGTDDENNNHPNTLDPINGSAYPNNPNNATFAFPWPSWFASGDTSDSHTGQPMYLSAKVVYGFALVASSLLLLLFYYINNIFVIVLLCYTVSVITALTVILSEFIFSTYFFSCFLPNKSKTSSSSFPANNNHQNHPQDNESVITTQTPLLATPSSKLLNISNYSTYTPGPQDDASRKNTHSRSFSLVTPSASQPPAPIPHVSSKTDPSRSGDESSDGHGWTCAEGLSYAVSFIVAVGVFGMWFIHRFGPNAWVLQDLFGFALVLHVIKRVRIPDMKISVLILCTSFFYDIFWGLLAYLNIGGSVDGTEGGMGESLPLSLLIPQWQYIPGLGLTSQSGPQASLSMLGLGDVVIPGLFLSYLFRMDVWNHTLASIFQCCSSRRRRKLHQSHHHHRSHHVISHHSSHTPSKHAHTHKHKHRHSPLTRSQARTHRRRPSKRDRTRDKQVALGGSSSSSKRRPSQAVSQRKKKERLLKSSVKPSSVALSMSLFAERAREHTTHQATDQSAPSPRPAQPSETVSSKRNSPIPPLSERPEVLERLNLSPIPQEPDDSDSALARPTSGGLTLKLPPKRQRRSHHRRGGSAGSLRKSSGSYQEGGEMEFAQDEEDDMFHHPGLLGGVHRLWGCVSETCLWSYSWLRGSILEFLAWALPALFSPPTPSFSSYASHRRGKPSKTFRYKAHGDKSWLLEDMSSSEGERSETRVPYRLRYKPRERGRGRDSYGHAGYASNSSSVSSEGEEEQGDRGRTRHGLDSSSSSSSTETALSHASSASDSPRPLHSRHRKAGSESSSSSTSARSKSSSSLSSAPDEQSQSSSDSDPYLKPRAQSVSSVRPAEEGTRVGVSDGIWRFEPYTESEDRERCLLPQNLNDLSRGVRDIYRERESDGDREQSEAKGEVYNHKGYCLELEDDYMPMTEGSENQSYLSHGIGEYEDSAGSENNHMNNTRSRSMHISNNSPANRYVKHQRSVSDFTRKNPPTNSSNPSNPGDRNRRRAISISHPSRHFTPKHNPNNPSNPKSRRNQSTCAEGYATPRSGPNGGIGFSHYGSASMALSTNYDNSDLYGTYEDYLRSSHYNTKEKRRKKKKEQERNLKKQKDKGIYMEREPDLVGERVVGSENMVMESLGFYQAYPEYAPLHRARLNKGYRVTQKRGRNDRRGGYFWAGWLGYLLGLIICMICLNYTHRGQPAMLFVVPCMLVPVVSLAAWRHELGAMWERRLVSKPPNRAVAVDPSETGLDGPVNSQLYTSLYEHF